MLLYSSVALAAAFAPLVRCFIPTGTIYQREFIVHQRSALHSTTVTDDEASSTYQISIEYGHSSRLQLKSFWIAQELLSTFQLDPTLQGITLLPSQDECFLIKCHGVNHPAGDVLWDQKQCERKYPEMKELKQVVRDKINPILDLGHSDRLDRQSQQRDTQETDLILLNQDSVKPRLEAKDALPEFYAARGPHISITYCTGCRWLMRAAYVAQELFTTFADDLRSLTFVPGRPPIKGGAFLVTLDNNILFDRAMQKRFPEVEELEEMIQERLVAAKGVQSSTIHDIEEEEAAEARKFFGVM